MEREAAFLLGRGIPEDIVCLEIAWRRRKRLQQLRQSHGLSFKDLGLLVGVSPTRAHQMVNTVRNSQPSPLKVWLSRGGIARDDAERAELAIASLLDGGALRASGAEDL